MNELMLLNIPEVKCKAMEAKYNYLKKLVAAIEEQLRITEETFGKIENKDVQTILMCVGGARTMALAGMNNG